MTYRPNEEQKALGVVHEDPDVAYGGGLSGEEAMAAHEAAAGPRVDVDGTPLVDGKREES